MSRRTLLAIVVLLAAPRLADACSCVEMPVCQRFWTADAVFTGVVTNITWSDDKKQKLSHTTIVVERGFSGASGQVVLTGIAISSCHYNFAVGERYLVYAHRRPNGTLTTSDCSGTKRLADADADLDYAERLPPPGSGGRIYGRVRTTERDLLDRRKSQEKFPSDVSIMLRDSRGNSLELRTDARGEFDAAGLRPDAYSISMDAPATARVYVEPKTMELKDRTCVPVYISYESNGRIAGRIVDPSGQPASKVWVSAFSNKFTTKKEYPEASIETKMTDADGRYEIGPLPPGDYQLGVNIDWALFDSPYPPTYHPGVLTRDQAETITVREGELRTASFVLPRKLTRVTVSGTVMLADGTPASNVDVTLVVGVALGISSARTNAAGAFTLTGLSGTTYLVRASLYLSPENNGSAETTISVADEPLTGVMLILKKR